jgi:uncharacterized protein DUF6209
MATSQAAIRFLENWQQQQEGTPERGGRLMLVYDKTRLPRCFANWRGAEFGDTVASIRFHPRGDIVSGSVLAPVRAGENPPGPVVSHVASPLVCPVPDDATKAEIWFHNFYQTSSRCDAWDSRFGENYWFDVGGAAPRMPRQPPSYRTGAMTRPDVVSLLEQQAVKVNTLPPPAGGGPRQGIDLQTILTLLAWVNDTRAGANAWIDLHVFDGQDGLLQSDTLTLSYAGVGGDFTYAFSSSVYQGSTATPGSSQPRPDARKIQYRLYYEVSGQVFTDGILHQQELHEDALTS